MPKIAAATGASYPDDPQRQPSDEDVRREGVFPEPETDDEPADDPTSAGVDEVTAYDGWTNAQLTEEVKRRREAGRELHLDGRSKADVIAALRADDEAGEPE